MALRVSLPELSSGSFLTDHAFSNCLTGNADGWSPALVSASGVAAMLSGGGGAGKGQGLLTIHVAYPRCVKNYANDDVADLRRISESMLRQMVFNAVIFFFVQRFLFGSRGLSFSTRKWNCLESSPIHTQ